MNVPIARTALTEAEIESVLGPLRSGWLVQGPKVREFETKWSDFTAANHSLAVTSCTTGLHLAAVALGLGAGDEVIVPAFTWIATANIVEHQQAKTVFCDIDLETFNIDIPAMEAAITPRTKGIIPVHLFGLPANMDAVNAVAKKHGLWVIEDAACGFGATYHGKHVGTLGDAGSFSFHPRKAITTGEGGMVTTNNADLAETIRQLRDHGAAMSDHQRHLGPRPYLLADHPLAGYNQRMTDFQAALGAAQMDRAAKIVTERRRLAARFDEAFAGLDWLRTPQEPDGCKHSYQSYPCLFKAAEIRPDTVKRINGERNAWMEDLQAAGVSTRPATHAVHMLTYYREKYSLREEDMPNAFAANDCSISLPLFHGMTEAEQDYVIATVLKGPA
ncbi:aminotransferase class I/II-fold pyridoxal phosphate-dependent enzyme [Altererythrobacter confluentis]|uniref:Aminotransferase class I/II-fold pyridoxal phosphate-dependent enzyme n=2 Tax=Allopontixanthobacter confluentis TaxID=1849021 RepID=A0A6L7GHW4_9SPHN|nr:aminotransferase class I/II-fold pyridoxal phosphate-dependent enzyme [Allopontixanthobacter confluentis]